MLFVCVLERAEVLSELHDLAFAVPQLSKEYDLEVFSEEELDGSEDDTLYFPAKQSIVIRHIAWDTLALQNKDS